MIFSVLLLICLLCAAIPFTLFWLNLRYFTKPPEVPAYRSKVPAISVLIPVRNEAANIGRSLRSILASHGVDMEVVVGDDASTDATAEIVAGFAQVDSRVRLVSIPSLPPGWNGKQHACHFLAGQAVHPILIFLDADVVLGRDALARSVAEFNDLGVDLLSGFPRQEVPTFLGKLILPLIHFILLGFLPFHRMRHTRYPQYAAGCGQWFITRADVYARVGGHASIRTTAHDGIKLPRLYREHSRSTAVFDAASLAACRMYTTNREVWDGLSKNATEGMGSPKVLIVFSVLLFFGQLLPFGLLLAPLSPHEFILLQVMLALMVTIRIVSAWRFQQPVLSVLLHPLGIFLLLLIQWLALLDRSRGRKASWRGRMLDTFPV